jgi:hypothetical protein
MSSGGLDNDFWESESNDLGFEKSVPDPVQRSVTEVAERRLPVFRELLREVFPQGDFKRPKGNGRSLTVSVQVGSHWIGVIGVVKPGAKEPIWHANWRQDVSVLSTHHATGAQRSTTIEKAARLIKSDMGLTGWLGWVYQNICKVATEDIRLGLCPDNFLRDHSAAFRGAHDLEQISATWNDVGGMMIQRLPWKAGKLGAGFLCDILRNGKKIGGLGVRSRGDHWKYGGKIDVAEVNPLFYGQTLKFAHEVNIKTCLDADAAIERAETLYAKKLLEWLMSYSGNSGLRSFAG